MAVITAIIFFVVFIFCFALFASIWGEIAYAIGKSRGVKYAFWWGFGLGIIGIIVVACINPSENNKTEQVKESKVNESTEKVEGNVEQIEENKQDNDIKENAEIASTYTDYDDDDDGAGETELLQ